MALENLRKYHLVENFLYARISTSIIFQKKILFKFYQAFSQFISYCIQSSSERRETKSVMKYYSETNFYIFFLPLSTSPSPSPLSLHCIIVEYKKVSYPSHLDLSRPESLGLYATRNFVIKYEDSDKNSVSIAAWHVLPNKLVKRFHKHLLIDAETLKNISNDANYNENNLVSNNSYNVVEALIGSNFDVHNISQRDFFYEELLRKTKDPVVLYLHGNTGSRANGHRMELYKTLRKLGYHVIAIDFRGFADSSDHMPTEKGCVSDSLAAYIYVKNLTNNPLYVYGHSLGR